MNKKRITIISVITLILIYFVYSYFSSSSDGETYLTTKVKKDNFISEVITSGEAQSTSLKKIKGPSNLRKFRLNNVKIQDLVAEGTIVKKGDYVGRLDPSSVNEQILDARLNLETAQSKYTQQQLDTTLSLKQERNAIKDLRFTMEETKLELKQSIYEPPATIKKLEIKKGDTVRFLNEDSFFHNVFSLSDAALFDLGSFPKGDSKEVVFEESGEVEVECAIHPNMKMVIDVKDE